MKTNANKVGMAAAIALLMGVASSHAVSVNLTTVGSSGTINGAHFFQISPRPTGTGYIDPFVRINPGGNQSPEEGFNSSARPVMPDVNTSPQYTHDLQVGALAQVTYNGVQYYVFMLDINQTASSSLLSLDRLEIWTKSGAALTDANAYSDLAAGGASLKYNMDAGNAGNEVILDYGLNTGSGSGDMEVYIPVSLIGTTASDYVYLFSHFGDRYASNDGFEEWWAKQGQQTVPDAGSGMMLLGMGLMAVEGLRRRFAK